MLCLVPSALPSPHIRQRNTGGKREVHLDQISVRPGNWIFLPNRTMEHKGDWWSLGLNRDILSLLCPFSKCTVGLMVMMGREGVHTRIRKPGSGCAVVKEVIKGWCK